MNRKEQIIEALIQRLHQTGFKIDFTLSEIAKDVQIGKSTIYEYFPNKDDLLKEAVIHYLNDTIGDVDVVKDIDTFTFEEAFKIQLTALLEASYKSRNIMETLSPGFVKSLPDGVRDEIKKNAENMRQLMNERFTGFIKKGIEDGVINLDHAKNNVFAVRSLIVGAIMSYGNTEATYEIKDAVDEVYQAMITILNKK